MVNCNFQIIEHVTVPYGEFKIVPLSSSPYEKDVDVVQQINTQTLVCCSLKGKYGRCDEDDCIFFRQLVDRTYFNNSGE